MFLLFINFTIDFSAQLQWFLRFKFSYNSIKNSPTYTEAVPTFLSRRINVEVLSIDHLYDFSQQD